MANQTDEKERLDTLVDIGVEARNLDVEYAMQIATQVLEQSRAIGYRRGYGRGLNLKGSCYWQQGEYDKGLEVLKDALEIATRIKERRLEARVMHNMGNIYRDMGDLASVLTNFEKALAIYEELGDEFQQSVILTSISNLLYDLNDYDSALEYALKCLPIFQRASNKRSLINVYNTLGNIYFKKEKLSDALYYFTENIGLAEPETGAHVMAESGLGKVYYKMHDNQSASKYLTNALEQSKEMGNAEVQIICLFYLGRMHMDNGDFRTALKFLEAAYDLADEYMRRHDIMSIHEMLSALHDKMGNIPKAFYHLKSFEQLKEEIFKQTIINELRNLQVRQQIELAQKEKEVAERTAFLKHQFMANMSHEIRTPMNAIVGMTRLLLGKEPKPDQLKYLNAIQQSADNLLVIINDILDLSKIESGKIVIESIDFSLREVTHSVRDMLMLKAEEKQIDLKISIEQTIPYRLVGDPTRLNQVLINLAGNAVKFTEKGSVEINITIQKHENDRYWLRFDVVDTGIGIDAAYVDTIFDSFTQAGADTTRKFGGTGLGLTISKQLVNLMGGEISVKSELGKGTTFTTIIAFAAATNQEQEKKGRLLDNASITRLNRLKVLLVEDNEFNRMVAEDTLKETMPGIELHVAVNGQEAVAAVKKEQYDVVLMDIQMPVMDGVTATKLIRTTLPAPACNVRIIAMTANVLQEDVQQYFDIGMNAYVSKPFQTDELLLKMDAVMGTNTPVGQHTPVTESAPEFPELPAQVTDMNFLKQFTGGNMEKQHKYVGMFLDNAPKLLDSIERALTAKDYTAIKIAAHSLKPQLSYMGVKEDVSNIFLIEQSAGAEAHYDRLPKLIGNLKHLCSKAFEELRMNN